MADKRIYELTEASTVGSSDVLALDSQNMAATKKVKVKTITDPLSNKNDISSLTLTGSTNTTGGTIETGRYFYLDGDLVIAKTNIAAGATFTPGTNYVLATVGGELTDVKQTLSTISDSWTYSTLTDTENFEPGSFIRYTKVGSILFLNIKPVLKANTSLTGNTEYIIFTLPEGYRPLYYFRAISQPIDYYTIVDTPLECIINPNNGTVKLVNKSGISSRTATQEFYFQFVVALHD